MNGMIIYDGSLTGTTTNGVTDVVISRVPDHACRCDECRGLDESDLPLLALCKRYIYREIDFPVFNLERIKLTCVRSPLETAISSNFKNGSSDLDTALDFTLWNSQMESNEAGEHTGVDGPLREAEFRNRLEGLIYGYEIRMRTVHFWTRGQSLEKE